jgi:hypothetical protein
MPQNGFKTNAKTLPAPRSLHDMVALGTKVFLVSGANDSGGTAAGGIANIDSASVLPDGSTTDFKTVGYLPAARVQGDTVIANGFLIQLGGQNTAGASQNQIYVAKVDSNGNLGVFTTVSTFPKATMIGHRLVYARGYIYVIGGGAANNQEVYFAKLNSDGSFGLWSKTQDLPAALSFHAAEQSPNEDYIFVSGGIVGTTVQSAIYRATVNLDGTLGKWVFVGSMAAARWRHSMVMFNSNLYNIGGSPDNVANSALATVEFHKVNSDLTLGATTVTGSLFNATRNAKGAFIQGLFKLIVAGGHVAAGTAASAIMVAHVQGDAHI